MEMNKLVLRVLLYLVALAVAAAVSSFGEGGGAPYQLVQPRDIAVQFSDIGGLMEEKKEIFYNILLPLRNPRFFRDDRLRPPRGHMFVGPPGTGKTMLARAIAKTANVPFLSITLSSMQSKYFGETERAVADIFRFARANQPIILLFDECEAAMRSRSAGEQECTYGLKTELLNQLDGMESKTTDAVVVIACTNCPDMIDPAFRRRLPKVHHIGLPTRKERAHILRLVARNEPHFKPSEQLLDATRGFSGSDLRSLYEEAASRRLRSQIEASGLQAACSDLRLLSAEDWRIQ